MMEENPYVALMGLMQGTAAGSHTHGAGDISSGTLPLSRGGTGATNADAARTALGAAAKSTRYSKTITTTWSGSAAPYTQAMSVTGVTSSNVVEVSLSSTATKDQKEAFAALDLTDGGQTSGRITLKAWGVKNTMSIPVDVIVRGDL